MKPNNETYQQTQLSDRQRDTRFMYIDDNPVNLFLVNTLFKKLSFTHELITLTSGYEGLLFLAGKTDESELPDVILLDIHMPGMTGFQFLELLDNGRVPNGSRLNVVMLSSSVNPDDVKKSAAFRSVKTYVEKPLNESKLQMIFSALGIK